MIYMNAVTEVLISTTSHVSIGDGVYSLSAASMDVQTFSCIGGANAPCTLQVEK